MRTLILKEKYASAGAKFCAINGAEAAKETAGFDIEANAIRNSATLSDFSFTRRFVYDESDGLDFLDAVLAQNILKLRYGRIINTFLSAEDGSVAAECFVANIDDKVYLVAESIAQDSYLDEKLLSGCASANDITEKSVMFAVDGPEAWRVAKDVCGSDIMNLPYLSIENYDFEDERIQLMRNGKTGEFGYQFIAPTSVAEKLFDAIKTSLDAINGVIAGTDVIFNARLEGNFFNVYAEGATVKDPIALGIQWMIDMEKETFPGSDIIFERRREGVDLTMVGMKGLDPLMSFTVGDEIFCGSEPVAKIVSAGYSKVLGAPIALAMFCKKYGLAGFEYSTAAGGPLNVSTVSMSPIVPLSLQNGLDS